MAKADRVREYNNLSLRVKHGPPLKQSRKNRPDMGIHGRGRVINNQSVSMHPDAVARRERRAGGVYLSSKAPVQMKGTRLTMLQYKKKLRAKRLK